MFSFLQVLYSHAGSVCASFTRFLWTRMGTLLHAWLNKSLPRHQLWVWSGSSGTSLRVHWFQSTRNHFTSSFDCGYTNSITDKCSHHTHPNLIFRRLPGLQLLFFLCQLLILPRKNCALAISNLIVRNFSNAIAITSGLSSPSFAQPHPYYPPPSHAPGTLHFMCVICPGSHYSMPLILELYCCLY